MENLRIHFRQRQRADWPLEPGVHRLVRSPAGTLEIGDAAKGALLAQFCADERGLWLQVADGMRGVHVNGRPISRMAMLRAGDSVYADGVEMLLRGVAVPPGAAAAGQGAASTDDNDPRVVLRGIGGVHHGRGFPLLRPCEVGSAATADIAVDGAGIAPRHARLERRGDRVLLRSLDAPPGTILVNGVEARDAWLSAGDQVVFGPQARYVVEVPWHSGARPTEAAEADDDEPAARAGTDALLRSARRWPWLLLAALLLGAALSALLLFGAG